MKRIATWTRALAAPVGAALVLASSGVGWADTVDECVNANTAAQALRRDGKLTVARSKLLQCGSASCPAIVRDDCTRRLDEVERAMPTLVFDFKDGAGRDLVDVTATVDGKPVNRDLVGKPLPFDPGEHVFVFTEAGQPPVTQAFVLKEGEKDRRERVVIGAPPPPVASASAPEVAPASGMPPQKLAALVAGGVGVAGLAVGAVFGAMTLSSASTQKNDCSSPTSCAQYAQASSAHSSGETDATISNIGFIAGGALLAAGVVLFFTAPRPAERPPAVALVIAPGLTPGGGGLWAKGEF